MLASDPRITRIDLDGKTLLVPNDAAWDVLDHEPVLDGRRIATGAILEHHRVLARKLASLVVALGEERVPDKPWVVIHVATIAGAQKRVVVESSNCLACGESRLVGVTRNYDLYVDTDDPLEAVRAHASDPVVPCVACGGALDRPAVVVFENR